MTDYPEPLREKLNELAWYLDTIKNGMSVRLDGNKAVTRIFTGQKLVVDVSDRSLAPHLLLDGYWELEISKLFQRLIKSSDIVLDIGANFGYFSLLAGTIVSSGEVHALEANPELIEYIDINRNINGLEGIIRIGNYLVGDNRPPLRLKIFSDYLGDSSMEDILGHDESRAFRYIDVKNITIDEYCANNAIQSLDIVKIDIEGAEFRAIRGMQKIIDSSLSKLIILMEYTPIRYGVENEAFIAYLKTTFTNIYLIKEDGSLSVTIDWTSSDLFMLLITNQDLL